MIPEVLLLVKQIRSRTSQINNLRTPISVLLEARAFKAVESVGNAFSTAHHTFVLIVAKGAFVTYTDKGSWANIAIAYRAFAVAFVAEAANSYARLLAAHY